MKKLLLALLLYFVFASLSFADYLDSWSNNDLCGWTTSSSTPKHIADEVNKRNISCSRSGKEVTSDSSSDVSIDIVVEDANGEPIMPKSDLPSSGPVETENGTLFPSPPPTKPGDAGYDSGGGNPGSGSGSGSGSDDKPAERLTPIV